MNGRHWATRHPLALLCSSLLKTKKKLEIHKGIQYLGDVYLAEGDQHTAISLFTVALEGFTVMDVHRSRGECMLRLGDILNQDGDILKAVNLWETGRPLFERSSQAKQTTGIAERLAGFRNKPQSSAQSGVRGPAAFVTAEFTCCTSRNVS
jgi:hypothetical protein